jgi:hypothetical protein
MRVLLLIVATVVVVVAGAVGVVRFVRFDGGPLDEPVGNGLSGPWPANVALALGLLEISNDSNHDLVVERVRLGPHARGLRFLGVRLAEPRCYDGSTMATFPPRARTGCRFRGAGDVKLAPHERLEGFVGVRGRPGSYRIHGVVVEYRRPLALGLSLRLRAHTGVDWGVCMAPNWPHRCRPPRF